MHDAPAAAEKPFESDAAREAVLRAQARFEDGDYRGAAIEFERAYGMLSAGPRRYAVLNNLAVCYERTFAFDEALATYERYLREAEPTGSDRAEVEQIVRGLRDLLGGLRVTSGAVARVFIDDRERGSIPLEVRLTAGTHVVELRAPGFQTVRRSVRIFPRQQLQLAITLTSEVRFHGAHRSYFWSGVALTAVTAAVGAGFGGRAVRESRRARERAKTDIATVEDEANIRRSTLTADIALGSAALFGVGSLVLGLLTDFRAPRDSVRSSKSSALNVTAAPTPGKSGAMLTFHGAVR